MPDNQNKEIEKVTLDADEERNMLGRKFIIANMLLIFLILIYLLFFG